MTVAAETLSKMMVGFDERPYNLFAYCVGNHRYFGWKEPVAFACDSPVPPGRSCLAAFADVIGDIQKIEITESGYELSYCAVDPAEAAAAVCADPQASELVYPLRRLVAGAETVQTAAYWNERAANPDSLDDDEWFMREAAAALLGPVLRSGDLVFDPACSTGRFLAAIGEAAPLCRLRGQELSPPMAELARSRLSDVYVGSAAEPCCADGEARVVIARFLNLDVLTSAEAGRIFLRLSRCVAVGGYMLLLGHTPILLDGAALQVAGFALHNKIMLTPDRHAAYQFYLLQKLA